MRNHTKIISLLFSLIMVLSMFSLMPFTISAIVIEELPLWEHDGSTLTGYNGTDAEIVIPTKLGDDEITVIDSYAFKDRTNLTSVTIPSSVISIGERAFYDCTSLSSVTIPDSVTGIGVHAFDGTAWYENQPDGLVYAGKVAYKMEGDCPDIVEIKQGTNSIANSAFYDCESLTSITIPDSVISIGSAAFYGCTNLTSVIIPDSVTSIGRLAFCDCSQLTDISIPNSVTYIGDSAFYNTPWYNNQPEGVVYAGKIAYNYKGTLPKELALKPGTISITAQALWHCKDIEKMILPDSLREINSYAFADSNIKEVVIPNGVEKIGFATFCNNPMQEIAIPASVTFIGELAIGYAGEFYIYPIDGFTIYGYKGTEAERYANDNGFTFIALDDKPEPKIGDTDGDGEVTVTDVTWIQRALSYMDVPETYDETAADVDGDGGVTITDATWVQRWLARMDTPYTIGK